MKTLHRKEAVAQGYYSITDDIVIGSEMQEHMTADMRGVDAVWIQTGDFRVQLGRKRSDLKFSK